MATEIDLGSVIGPQGPQGPKGATGATGPQGPKGDPFAVAKVYQSVASMNAGYASDGVAVGGFVVIETGSVDNEDNAKLYVKGDAAYEFVADLSGAQGIQGPQGPKGSTGPTGPEGPKGDTGETGPQGPVGATPEVSASATVGAGVGTPSVTVTKGGTAAAPTLAFEFSNLKGETGETGPQGPKGDTGSTGPQGPEGAAAGFGAPTATVDANVGTPSVSVTATGSDTNKVFAFEFKNLKGETGATGAQGPKGETGAAGANGADGKTPTFSINEAGHLIATYE